MLRLILALPCPKEGRMWVCAEENREEKYLLSASARSLFSYVPQGNTMFSGTIAENLRTVKRDASDEELIEALKPCLRMGFCREASRWNKQCSKRARRWILQKDRHSVYQLPECFFKNPQYCY
ncbi:MAG: hypothetical protein V8S84_07150 [Lachnospiraceae bacterium]